MQRTGSERAVLAPTGKLRVGVYHGSPLSMLVDRITAEVRGLGFDLGSAFAKRLGVPFEMVNHPRIAAVLAAIKAGDVDFTLSNATPARAAEVAFSPTLLSLELGYLVPAASAIRTIGDLDRPGITIGVAQGSTSERTLPQRLGHARIVATPNLPHAIDALARCELDAFATNKPILFEMSDRLPGARVLDGRWGEEHIAIAIPKGRDRAMDYLNRFVDDVKADGTLARAARRAGLRGVI
jgi:polar amino acid transport system substrate-binding protein